ncbi:hypothetical protein [Ponticoccus sp. (in: a-proteobacteria)]|uniref:hypothetical protein n=1 Tax=Ponticoccus sp. (in: a-proteobacteria) TaxID=1925025 RepID=UPI003AB3B16A
MTCLHPRLLRPLLSAFTLATLGLVVSLTPGSPASAAEITRRGSCEASLTGQIDPGDGDRLQAIRDSDSCRYFELYLSSPGGSVKEALSIADSLMNVITFIEADQQCLSACALIFMAARTCGGAPYYCAPTRNMHPTATLGFHAPFLKPGQAEQLVPLDLSFKAALGIFADIQNTFSRISASVASTGYSGSMIHADLFAKMFSTPPEEFYTIVTNDQFHTFGIGLTGDVPEDRAPDLTRGQAEMLCYNVLYDTYRGWNHSEYGFEDYGTMTLGDVPSVADYRRRGNEQFVRFDGLNLGIGWSGWCQVQGFEGNPMLDVALYRGDAFPSQDTPAEERDRLHYSMAYPAQTPVAGLSWGGSGSGASVSLPELTGLAREYFRRLDRTGNGAPSALWIAEKRAAIDSAASGICAAEALDILNQSRSGRSASVVLRASVTACGASSGESYRLRMEFTDTGSGWQIMALSSAE